MLERQPATVINDESHESKSAKRVTEFDESMSRDSTGMTYHVLYGTHVHSGSNPGMYTLSVCVYNPEYLPVIVSVLVTLCEVTS